VPVLSFNQISGSSSVYPPLNTEISVDTVSVPNVGIGQNLKVDYALAVEFVATANASAVFSVRLYRDTTLISTRTFSRMMESAGTQRFPFSNTLVDTAVAAGTVTYDLRVIFTTASNVTSAAAINRNINVIRFP
jgi:hypothetical protein